MNSRLDTQGRASENNPKRTPSDGVYLVRDNVRYPIDFLVERHKVGEVEPLERLLKAIKTIKEKEHKNQDSFTYIAGLHGKPFLIPPDEFTDFEKHKDDYWGGYCPHKNVLFPLWHRAYVNHFERALQKVDARCTMAYWDEMKTDTDEVLPKIFTQEEVEIDGKMVPNPLRSHTFPIDFLNDQVPNDEGTGPKVPNLKGSLYTTVRFPLCHDDTADSDRNGKAKTANDAFTAVGRIEALEINVRHWLNGFETEYTKVEGTREKYKKCLETTSYTEFSNVESMTEYNLKSAREKECSLGWSLEGAHDEIHMAVGNSKVPFLPDSASKDAEIERDGDMGAPERSAFDPIFFFHHCFVDKLFWDWQVRHRKTKELDIRASSRGASTSHLGPGRHKDQKLNLETELMPFKKPNERYYTGNDLIDLEELGIKYGEAVTTTPTAMITTTTTKMTMTTMTMTTSEEAEGAVSSWLVTSTEHAWTEQSLKMSPLPQNTTTILVTRVDQRQFFGSFIVSAFIVADYELIPIGYEVVFARENPKVCTGCMSQRLTSFVFKLDGLKNFRVDRLTESDIKIEFDGTTVGDEEIGYKVEIIRS